MLAVITPVAGRHEHLLGQLRGLHASTRTPDYHVVVAMGDPDVADLVGDSAVVLDTPPVDGRLPLAAARNAGAERALVAGADVLVFLDVDCIPSPTLIERYAAAACRHPATLLSGPVAYLPPPTAGGYQLDRLSELGRAHPARPAVSEDTVQALDHELFWSLSFALDAATWTALGGFCERYTGYGGEDTDFAQLARARQRRASRRRRRRRIPPVAPLPTTAGAAPGRHRPQRQHLPRALGLVADDRMDGSVPAAGSSQPRPCFRPVGGLPN